MKRIICLLLIATVLLTGCSGATGNNTNDNQEIETDSTQEDETMESEELLTVEELIEATGINPDDYEDGVLDKFIEDFMLTTEKLKKWNIPFLLENYNWIDPIDVSDIFNPDRPKRESNFTENVVAVAFDDDWNELSHCVYYDLENDLRYRADLYIFTDLNSAEPTEYPDGQALVDKLNALGAFSWKDMKTDENMLDGEFAQFVVQYDDGSVFAVSFDNKFPKNYQEVKALLMNGD